MGTLERAQVIGLTRTYKKWSQKAVTADYRTECGKLPGQGFRAVKISMLPEEMKVYILSKPEIDIELLKKELAK